MTSSILRALALLLSWAVLAPATARAATYRDYLIAWQSTSYRSEGSCQDTSRLHQEGQANFSINAMPLPTRTIPGHYRVDSHGNDTNIFGAPFNATLLRWGPNQFYFNVMLAQPDQSCVITDDIVQLETGGLTARPLFLVKRRGTAYSGTTSVALDLKEINPRLSENLANLERVLEDRKWQLLSIHGDLARAQAELDLLAELKGEIDELSKRPLDSITEADLNDILSRYGGVDPRVLSQLQQLLRDLKEDLAALRTEIDRIMSDFRGQMGGLDDWLAGTPPTGSPDLGDSGTYDPDLDPGSIPDVETPDLDVGDDFDPDNDPYLAYATQVLQQLETTRSAGVVVNRSGFMTIVRSWRQNQGIFEKAIQSRASVSMEEVGAFINARDMVWNVVRESMDEAGWFLDTPVRPSTKALIAYLRKRPEAAHQADGLQSNLNLWQGDAPTAQQNEILNTLDGLHGGWQSVEDGAAVEDPSIISTLLSIGDSAQVIIKEVALFGVGMTPVGDFIDFCEVITGWETCMPNGTQLSTGERVFTAMGMVVGTGRFWRAVGNAVTPVGKVVADRCEALIKRWYDIPDKVKREELVERLGQEAIDHVDGLSGKDVERLLNGLGDSAVQRLAKHLKKAGLLQLEKLSMLQIPAAKRSHAVANGGHVKSMGTMKGKTVAQLEAELQARGFTKNADGNWVHDDFSVVRISPGTSTKPPYFRREITTVKGNTNRDAIAVKVTGVTIEDDLGSVEYVFSLPEWADDTIGVSKQIRNWFASMVNRSPNDLDEFGQELLELEKYWGKQTHFDLEP
ncbi:hypothetical protein [Myxococcus qinghaiensis]|uniref:hypothetical protein n=1 Tax=Myxococcus qinghaiensis TaxID=2906758 RepID=UPI0020A70967|nr:hypothetical protein [Myxococcus qinghaiensis]MCP3166433.1 hypothetical protein [Myxococcus qinghaiensis]